MAKQRSGTTEKRASIPAEAARTIAAQESGIQALKREVEATPSHQAETRRHLYLMIAKHYELLAKEYKALAKERGSLA